MLNNTETPLTDKQVSLLISSKPSHHDSLKISWMNSPLPVKSLNYVCIVFKNLYFASMCTDSRFKPLCNVHSWLFDWLCDLKQLLILWERLFFFFIAGFDSWAKMITKKPSTVYITWQKEGLMRLISQVMRLCVCCTWNSSYSPLYSHKDDQ